MACRVRLVDLTAPCAKAPGCACSLANVDFECFCRVVHLHACLIAICCRSALMAVTRTQAIECFTASVLLHCSARSLAFASTPTLSVAYLPNCALRLWASASRLVVGPSSPDLRVALTRAHRHPRDAQPPFGRCYFVTRWAAATGPGVLCVIRFSCPPPTMPVCPSRLSLAKAFAHAVAWLYSRRRLPQDSPPWLR